VAEIRYELLAEEDVTDAQRRLAGALLHEVFGKKRVLRRGWILHRPAYRVLAWEGDDLVGAEMGCLVDCTPPLDLHGFGDAAVREDARGHGIARRMGALVLEEAQRRRADAGLCKTSALAQLVLEHGMVPVRPGELYHNVRGRRQPLLDGWFIKWFGEPVAPLVIKQRF